MPCFSKRRIEPIDGLHCRAKQGDKNAQYELGLCYLNGVDAAISGKNARFWFKKAEKAGHIQAQERLGYCYENGIGGRRDQGKGVRLTRQASERGDPTAQFRYASYLDYTYSMFTNTALHVSFGGGKRCYYDKRILNERSKRRELFVSAAEQGNADAQIKVAKDTLKTIRFMPISSDVIKIQESIIYARNAVAQGRTEAQELLDKFIERLKRVDKLASIPRLPSPLPGELDYKKSESFYLKEQFTAALPGLEAAARAGYPPAFVLLYEIHTHYHKLEASKSEKVRQYQKLISKSINWYHQYCAYNESVAQFCLGWCYFHGIGETESIAYAKSYFETATFNRISGQCPLAYNWLALCLDKPHASNRDKSTVFKAYLSSANSGNLTGEYNLGRCYEDGIGTPKNLYKARQCYRSAQSKGKSEASERLAFLGRALQEQSAEFTVQHKAALAGDTNMQNKLGENYEKGLGVVKNDRQAVEWYRKSAQQNDPTGAYNLARCYEFGIGVIKSFPDADYWYRAAAQKNHTNAIKKLSTLEKDFQAQQKQTVDEQLREANKFWRLCKECPDKNSPKKYADHQRALQLCRPLAESGNLEAQMLYGDYLIGDSTFDEAKRNEKEGIEWYLKASNKNYKPAFIALGSCYSYGMGVIKDYAQAETWYLKSVNSGDTKSYLHIGEMYDCAKFDSKISREEKLLRYEKAIHYLKKAESKGYTSVYTSASNVQRNLNEYRRVISERDDAAKKAKIEEFRRIRWAEIRSTADYGRNVRYNKKIEADLSPEDKILFRRVVDQTSEAGSIKLEQERKENERREMVEQDIATAIQTRDEKSFRRRERTQKKKERDQLRDYGRTREEQRRADILDYELRNNW